MTDRLLIKGGIVLTQDPALGELADADVLIEDDTDRGRRPGPAGGRRAGHRRHRRHRHPGLHRHPPAHLGDVDPDVRAGLRADHLLRVDPRQVRAALPARRRLRRQPVGLARVHQRGHHDARRLVAHHEHAGPRRRGDPRAPGLGDPVRVRLRVPEHLAPGLVVRPGLPGQRPDLGRRRRAADPQAVLQLGRRPGHDGARHARSQLLQAGRGPPRLGAGQGARPQHHGPRRDGPLRLHQDAGHDAPGHGPAVPEHDVRPRVALHRRRNGRWSATRAATCRSRRRSRSRWATAGRRP